VCVQAVVDPSMTCTSVTSSSLILDVSAADDASLTTTHMSSLPSHLSCMSITNNSSSLHTCTASATSNQLPVPSHVSAVQETALPHAGQTAVYCRTSELSQNTASGCRNTASPDSESTQNVPISSTQTSSVSRSRTADFTSIEIPQREYPAELREPEYDAVLISTVEDAHIAEVFRNILSKFITLEVCARFVSGNRKDCGRKSVQRKKYHGMHGWAYSCSRLCGCCRPASGHTLLGVSERRPVINHTKEDHTPKEHRRGAHLPFISF